MTFMKLSISKAAKKWLDWVADRSYKRSYESIYCFVHPIFSFFGFWYFGHFSCVIFFPFFFHFAHLALQNVNKDYVIFSYFRNFMPKVTKTKKPKMGWTKHKSRKKVISKPWNFLIAPSIKLDFKTRK